MDNSTSRVYLRASTHNQDFTSQEHALQTTFGTAVDHVKRHKDIESGTKSSRPAYDTLKREIRQGQVKTVYIYAWDRLARSIKELMEFCELANRFDVRILSVKSNIDTGGIMGKAMVAILGICAEFEHAMITSRLRAGLRRKIDTEGWRPGGSEPGWIAEKTKKRAKMVHDLIDSGHSINAICQQLKMDARTVKRLIALRGQRLTPQRECRENVEHRNPPRPDMYKDKS